MIIPIVIIVTFILYAFILRRITGYKRDLELLSKKQYAMHKDLLWYKQYTREQRDELFWGYAEILKHLNLRVKSNNEYPDKELVPTKVSTKKRSHE